jgi:hypothetical protein
VPVSVTGDPATAALAVMVAVPEDELAEVGVNTMLMVQLRFAFRVPPQVPGPPCAPVARENGAVTEMLIPVRLVVLLL